MPLTVAIHHEQTLAAKLDQEALVESLQQAFQQAYLGPTLRQGACLSLFFLDDEAMQEENLNHRGIDASTDVLSFPMLEMDEGRPKRSFVPMDFNALSLKSRRLVLGDLLISLPRVEAQAERYGHSFERELHFLAVHGLLHLLGYDHEEDAAAQRMDSLSEAILGPLGFERQPSAAAPPIQRAGHIAILGRPNVGKSTLLNHLGGMDLAIVSHRPQTTRHLIRAIISYEGAQLVFIDSPGMHPIKHQLDRYMSKSISLAMDEADLYLLLVDVSKAKGIDPLEEQVMARASARKRPLIIAFNKIDRIKKSSLLPLFQAFSKAAPKATLLPISALEGEGIQTLLELIVPELPEGPALYDPEVFTDQSERRLAQEYIRAEILLQMKDEIPHGTAVHIDRFQEEFPRQDPSLPRRRVQIDASIICERKQHKGMLLGKRGARIKEIGSRARERIAKMLDCPTDLMLYVKTEADWRQKAKHLDRLGYGIRQLGE